MTKKTIPLMRMAGDSAAALFAFGAAYALRQWGPIQSLRFPIQPISFYLPLLPPALLLLVIIFRQHDLYDTAKRAAGLPELERVVRATFVWLVLLMAASYAARTDPSRALVLLTSAFAVVSVVLARSFLQIWENQSGSRGRRQRILVVGTHADLERVRDRITSEATEIAGTVGLDPDPRSLGTLDDLPAILRRTGVSEVAFADPRLPRDVVLNILAAAAENVRFRVVADFFPLLPDPGTGHLTLNLAAPRRGFWIRSGKRTTDVLLAAVSMPLALPLCLAIAFAIRRDSEGPLLFSHERIGRGGKPFRMLKFRTMRANTPAIADAPRTPDDARITRLGRWLRRWSLDELPQLWNVFRGDMSLVGPRPEMPHLVAQYAPWQRIRLRVRPGLTGLWQVLGRKELPLHQHLEYDVYYVNNVSVSLDVAILLKTVPRILGGRGAF